MNKNSNTYTVVYATVMVVVVAALLAFTAISLAPRQDANVLTEKMGAILGSIGQAQNADKAPNKDAYIKDEFTKYIKRTFFVNAQGQQTDAEVSAVLNSLGNLPEIFANKEAMPVFEAKIGGDSTLYVVPVTGKGLWGPVWGYIALNADCNTVYGVKFDHKSETPGLGAEISLPFFSKMFIGKKLFDTNGKFTSVTLTKGVGTSNGNEHAVDAITGGTLTSNGVRDMLKNCLGDYAPFFESVHQQLVKPAVEPIADTIPAEVLTPAQAI